MKYFQKQIESHLCRLYAINNFFGKEMLNKKQFLNYVKQFDIHQKKMFGIETGSLTFDYINSDCVTLVSFILNKMGFCVEYFPIKKNVVLPNKDRFLAFTKDHIFCFKKDSKNLLYKYDSLLRRPVIHNFKNYNNVGLIVPVDCKQLYLKHKSQIKIKTFVKDYINFYFKNGMTLNGLEVNIAICCNALSIQNNNNCSKDTPVIVKDILKLYTLFITNFSKQNNKKFISEMYIPEIVKKIFLC
mgnify:CR=1 FL=1